MNVTNGTVPIIELRLDNAGNETYTSNVSSLPHGWKPSQFDGSNDKIIQRFKLPKIDDNFNWVKVDNYG